MRGYPLALTPAQMSLRGKLAAHTRWSQTDDPTAATEPARRAFLDRFERQVDPEGTLDPAERARRASSAKSAYFAGLALKSSQARRAKQAPAQDGASK